MVDFKWSDSLFKEIIDEVNTGIALVDSKGSIVYANSESKELLGIRTNEDGKEFNIISCHPYNLQDTVKQKLNGEGSKQKRLPKKTWHRTIYHNGRWVDNYLSVIVHDEFKGVIIISKDSTEEVELRQALEKANSDLSNKCDNVKVMDVSDSLTGVYNRHYLDEIITGKVELDADHVGVMMIDINGLKKINYALGYQKGDEFLKQTAVILKNSILGKDIPIRYDEDKFLVLLPDCKDTGAKRIRERIESNVEKWNDKNNDTEFNLELAIGCTSGKIDKLREVIESAGELMYNDKRKKQK